MSGEHQAGVPVVSIAELIREVRGERVILDADLAALYGVPTGRLNEAVRRSGKRFPEDFCFVLTRQEFTDLISQFAISSWGGRRKLPTAFTEHGAIMAANVLNSPKAVEMSVYVVRAFVQMRRALQSNAELSKRLEAVERRLDTHDESIRSLVLTVRQLINPEVKPRRPIGFKAKGP